MNKVREILIKSGRDEHFYSIIDFTTTKPWKLRFSLNSEVQYEIEGTDLFDCLAKLRENLDKRHLMLLCNGSRVDVYPSSMMRQMSGGRIAYIHRLGKHCTNEDVVDIFDFAEANMIGTVQEQKSYYRQWFNSLKR